MAGPILFFSLLQTLHQDPPLLLRRALQSWWASEGVEEKGAHPVGKIGENHGHRFLRCFPYLYFSLSFSPLPRLRQPDRLPPLRDSHQLLTDISSIYHHQQSILHLSPSLSDVDNYIPFFSIPWLGHGRRNKHRCVRELGVDSCVVAGVGSGRCRAEGAGVGSGTSWCRSGAGEGLANVQSLRRGCCCIDTSEKMMTIFLPYSPSPEMGSDNSSKYGANVRMLSPI